MEINIVELETQNEIERVLNHFLTSFHQETLTIDSKSFSSKLYKHGRVLKAFNSNELFGFVAFYANNYKDKLMYISLIATASKMHGTGIGTQLLNRVVALGRQEGFEKIVLEVFKYNQKAISFYSKNRFKIVKNAETNNKITMEMIINYAEKD